ncbi:MAG: protein translocase subunit SecF [Candidatus Krumholzibacteria bacterium]|nr:protein translocase subunit SecF [Candidatus Krumholzibacteria bacterium]
MRLIKETHIDFISVRRRTMNLSLALIVVGFVSVAIHKGFNMGIDFAGGTLVEVRFEPAVPLEEVRAVVESAGFSGAEVTHFGDEKEVLIKVKAIGAAAEASERITLALREHFADSFADADGLRRVESVGPKIGSELKTAAFWAIIYSLAGIVVYISWRFEFRFAVGAIIALIHDVLITLGFFSVTDREISIPVIAGILTVVGYSLNDTIVVFDRIRENLRSRKREGYQNVVNASINETLSRTIITSLTTLAVVLCLVILGGPVIRDFALTLLVGVLVGTYSSIFVASPVLVEWEAWQVRRKKRKK